MDWFIYSHILPANQAGFLQDAIYSFSCPIVVFLPLLSAEHLGRSSWLLWSRVQRPASTYTLREAASFNNSPARKGIWKGRELFLLTVWDDCRFAYSYCDWRRLSQMLSTNTMDSFSLITSNFLLVLPWLCPLWAPPFCLLTVRSLDSLLALWWHKHRHNHMFSCDVGTMLKCFCFSRIFLSFLVLCFENITFLGLFPVVCPYFCSYFSFHSRIYEAQRKYR